MSLRRSCAPGRCGAGSSRSVVARRRWCSARSAVFAASPRPRSNRPARRRAQPGQPDADGRRVAQHRACVDQETGIRGLRDQRHGRTTSTPYTQGVAEREATHRQDRGLLGPAATGDIRASLRAGAGSGPTPGSRQVADPVIDAVRDQGPTAGQALVDAAATAAVRRAARGHRRACRQQILVLRDQGGGRRASRPASTHGGDRDRRRGDRHPGRGGPAAAARPAGQPPGRSSWPSRCARWPSGDYDRHITSGGSPELAALAARRRRHAPADRGRAGRGARGPQPRSSGSTTSSRSRPRS